MMMNKQKILSDINNKIDLVDDELKNGFSIEDQNNMVIEEVLDNNLPTILNTKSVKNFSDLHFLKKAIGEIGNTMKVIHDEIEINNFFSDGKLFDTNKLRKKYIDMNLKDKFPNFDIEKYLKILNNPILEFKNFKEEIITYDRFWVRKNMIAINQMIFDSMDLYSISIGKEGSGKSLWSSQQILYFYKFLKLVGLIDYAYDVTKLFFIDIISLLDFHDTQKKNEYFRIECLDEGNELNRSNFREEANQRFKFEMRTERKLLRVFLINIQQIGELDVSVSLSRINFIYDCTMKSNTKLGTLNKGFLEMYVIPRTNTIYSDKHKKILTRNEILNKFAKRLDKKSEYYVGLPKNLIVKEFKFENKWGFDTNIYDDHIKDELMNRKFKKSIKMTDIQAYILMNKISNFVKLGTFDRKKKSDNKMYLVLHKFLKKIENYFKSNPEKLMVIEKQYDIKNE